MPLDPRLESLLLRWEELREQGRSVSVAELCRDCPELSDPLRERIAALEQLGWLDKLQRSGGGPGGLLLGPGSEPVPGYVLEKRLGRGGFGEVWRARGPGNVAVALKLLPLDSPAAALEQRALAALRELRHPHLLAILGVWHNDDLLIIGLELAECSLLDLLRSTQAEGATGIARAVLLDHFRSAAKGLDFLHTPRPLPDESAEGLIQHRDVKPQNLLLVGGCVKVADFGLARLLRHSATSHTGSFTAAYAAPEFLEGRTTPHSDQYSLAVSWCHLRGGRLPFEGTPAQMITGHLHRAPDLSMVPAEERPIVARALDKQPARRWPSCSVFVEALANPPAAPRSRLRRRAFLAATTGLTVGGVFLWTRRARAEPPLRLERRLESDLLALRTAVLSWTGQAALSIGGTPARLWDLESGQLLREFTTGPGVGVAIGPFGEVLATGNEEGRVTLWDYDTGAKLRELAGHTNSISRIAFSPNGRQVLTTCCDQTIRLWDRATGRELQCLRGHDNIVMAAAFLSGGSQVLSGGWDCALRLWDLRSGKQVREFLGHRQPIRAVAVTFDGQWAVSSGDDATVRVWEVEAGREVQRLEGHTMKTEGVCFTREGDQVLSCGHDDTLRLWERESGRLVQAVRVPNAAFTSVACLDARVLTGGHQLMVWRLHPYAKE